MSLRGFDEYIDLIIRKAELLKGYVRHCASSDVMLWANIHIEDIIRAAKVLREELRKA